MIAAEKPLTIDAATRVFAQTLSHCPAPMLDARLVMQHVLQLDDAQFILAGPDLFSEENYRQAAALIARRAAREPMAYILGEKEFRSLQFRMRPGVLAPRPDSETLIDMAERLRRRERPLNILDLGVGSGCLLITLLKSFPNATGIGVDCSEEALRLVRENARRHGVDNRLSLVAGHWMRSLSRNFDLIISNPPYIRTSDCATLSADILEYEDHRALFAGADGLDAYREILAAAPERLVKNGLIILELGQGQAGDVVEIARRCFAGATISLEEDFAGIPRALAIDCA